MIARGEGRSTPAGRENLDDYELYVIIKQQIKLLREDMDGQGAPSSKASLSGECSEPSISEVDHSRVESEGVSERREMSENMAERYKIESDGGLEATLLANKWKTINSAAWELR